MKIDRFLSIDLYDSLHRNRGFINGLLGEVRATNEPEKVNPKLQNLRLKAGNEIATWELKCVLTTCLILGSPLPCTGS